MTVVTTDCEWRKYTEIKRKCVIFIAPDEQFQDKRIEVQPDIQVVIDYGNNLMS